MPVHAKYSIGHHADVTSTVSTGTFFCAGLKNVPSYRPRDGTFVTFTFLIGDTSRTLLDKYSSNIKTFAARTNTPVTNMIPTIYDRNYKRIAVHSNDERLTRWKYSINDKNERGGGNLWKKYGDVLSYGGWLVTIALCTEFV